jgi:hypothetical protein
MIFIADLLCFMEVGQPSDSIGNLSVVSLGGHEANKGQPVDDLERHHGQMQAHLKELL